MPSSIAEEEEEACLADGIEVEEEGEGAMTARAAGGKPELLREGLQNTGRAARDSIGDRLRVCLMLSTVPSFLALAPAMTEF